MRTEIVQHMAVIETATSAPKPWIARVTGLDPTFQLAREFQPHTETALEPTLKHRLCEFVFPVYDGDFFEYRGMDAGHEPPHCGFLIARDGHFTQIDKAKVFRRFMRRRNPFAKGRQPAATRKEACA